MYSFEEIAQIVHGEVLQSSNTTSISRVLLDSRKISQPKDSLFIAIKGARHNSHAFIAEVYAAGVRAFVVEQDVDVAALAGANVLRVKNSIAALQQMAAHRRALHTFPVIGITGSNGKTIVKEWLNTLLADDFNIVRSPKSWNSQIGVPLSVLNMEASHTLGIFEAGISQPGEMEQLAKIIKPDIGIFTSIGSAHSENFLSRRQLIGEKLNLFAPTHTIICPDDGDAIQLLSAWAESKQLVLMPQSEKIVTPANDNSSYAAVVWKNETHTFHFPFADKASVENTLTCIYCMLVMNYSAEEIQPRLSRLAPLEMRMQLLNGDANSVIVNDAYSNDLHSLEIALDFLQQHAGGRKKIIVLSDILQTGLDENELHKRIKELLLAKNIFQLVGVGAGMCRNKNMYASNALFYSTTEEYLNQASMADYADAAVLVKGARDFKFERIVSLLQEKTHDTVLEINLNALAHNLNYFKSKLLPSTKIMVMVKAFGYGSGAHEVASLLEFNKVDYLAVAYTDEGVALRKAGVSLPIMVLNAEQSSLPTLIRYKLEPEIYSLRTLQAFLKALENTQIKQPYPIHIKLDTGMHRLGFEADQLMELCAKLIVSPQIKVATVFTHLAATDESTHDAFTLRQLEEFEHLCKQLKKSIKQTFLMHALNTGGISRFPKHQMDMVRLGVGLYGIEVSAEDKAQLQTVGTLRTVISQIKNINIGESVGYSRKFVATKKMRIATIPVGYADGLRRSLSNAVGEVIISGKRCPVVGNVCMDMMMIDVTDIKCNEGDAVTVFGKEITVEEIAKKCGTIAYEILTSISQRVRRVYAME
jgi:Alr-MurF fusion protein